MPTYGYELAQAVTDGFLVDFLSVETRLKFLERGIVYDELSDEDKAAYEDTFGRDGEAPDSISSSALNEWVFNEDTIREVLHVLMTADYLDNGNLDSRQIYFVNQIVEYIVRNGMMKDLSVLQEAPFTDQGSVVEVFTDLSVWLGIRAVIDRINANAISAKNM